MPNSVESVLVTEPALLVRVARLYRPGMSERELYDCTRGVWRVGQRREQVRLALAIHDGIVLEVYEIQAWQPAGSTPYVSRSESEVSKPGRWEFVGAPAPEDVRNRYVGRSVAHYFKHGAQNPVAYVNTGKAERAVYR